MGEPYITDLTDSTTVTLDRILEWEEVKVSWIPVQNPIGEEALVGLPISCSDNTYIPYSVDPRIITIRSRLSRTNKTTMESLRDLFDWLRLYDYDGVLIDYVWMGDSRFNWLGDEAYDYPWMAELKLICSSL